MDREVEGQLEHTDVEALFKGVSIAGLPRNLMLVPGMGKPSSKTRNAPFSTSQPRILHKVLETAGSRTAQTQKHRKMLVFCFSFGFCYFAKDRCLVLIANFKLAVTIIPQKANYFNIIIIFVFSLWRLQLLHMKRWTSDWLEIACIGLCLRKTVKWVCVPCDGLLTFTGVFLPPISWTGYLYLDL